MAQEELDLLQIPAALSTKLRASAPEIVGSEVLDPDLLG
jgi:hypothetical protein